MYFKVILVCFILTPVWGLSQIRFVDTVSISGYFYSYVGKYHKTNKPTVGRFDRDFYFVPESALQHQSFKEYLKNTYLKETDTVRFHSWQYWEDFGPYEMDASIKPWIEQVKGVFPFRENQDSYRCGIKGHRVFITYGNMQWLHIRMPGKVACEGFNCLYTFDCGEKAKGRDYDIYYPIKILKDEEEIMLKNGKLVHP
jgi:hypothetical protein